MRLGLHTDYALRTLMYLSARKKRASVAEVAAFYAISKDHVAKVVQSLVRHGYVRSIRGAGGGIEIARRPEDISVGQVIDDFEGNWHLLECVGVENVCVIQPGCKLRKVFAEAERLQSAYLHGVRLSDVVRTGGDLLEITGPERGGKTGTDRERVTGRQRITNGRRAGRR